jgi:hypothetical protein
VWWKWNVVCSNARKREREREREGVGHDVEQYEGVRIYTHIHMNNGEIYGEDIKGFMNRFEKGERCIE